MKILLALAAFLLALAATAQSYNKAIGVRLPFGTGISYKKFLGPRPALEFTALYASDNFRVSGLYEFHFPFAKVENLQWYVGPGAHLGFYKSDTQKNYSSKLDVGLDGVIGIDYKFLRLPVNVSVDWQPSVSLNGSGAQSSYGGVAIRYTF